MKPVENLKRRMVQVGAYQRSLDMAAQRDVFEAIRQGLDDVAHGRTRPCEVFDSMRLKYGIRR